MRALGLKRPKEFHLFRTRLLLRLMIPFHIAIETLETGAKSKHKIEQFECWDPWNCRRGVMGYVLRVRLASFFTGAALASAAGLYFLQKDYKIAHHAISQQVFVLPLSILLNWFRYCFYCLAVCNFLVWLYCKFIWILIVTKNEEKVWIFGKGFIMLELNLFSMVCNT